jgi:hypothetical protein
MKVLCFVVGVLVAIAPAAAAGESVSARPAAVGMVAVVQAVPDSTVRVSIDGKTVETQAAAGVVLGPYPLSAGQHEIDFSGADGIAVATTLQVEAKSHQDVVLHRPASVGGDAVVSSYPTPTEPIGPGKARVLVAHTATVAPADVVVDGMVVFSNIAKGEFATADVPAGKHVVVLFPAGQKSDPLLGPLDVTLAPGTVTMVYAVGEAASMELVVHVDRLAADGSVFPVMIDTGSAGLARSIPVTPFGPGSGVRAK